MLWKGEINFHGQCFTLYTHAHGSSDPMKHFSYQIAKKLYPEASPGELRTASRGIHTTLEDGFDRYRITEVKRDAG